MSQGFSSGAITDNTKIPLTEKGVPDGVATLGTDGLVPTSQLPATTSTTKAGVVLAGSFTGSPKTATVTFDTAFVDNNYSVIISGIDNRNWTSSSVTAFGFTINANANLSLGGQVFWNATHNGS